VQPAAKFQELVSGEINYSINDDIYN